MTSRARLSGLASMIARTTRSAGAKATSGETFIAICSPAPRGEAEAARSNPQQISRIFKIGPSGFARCAWFVQLADHPAVPAAIPAVATRRYDPGAEEVLTCGIETSVRERALARDGAPIGGGRARASACIGKSVVIKGEVLSSEDLVIDGCVEGTIKNSGHCLTISAGATIKANLVGRIIMISGAVTGTIAASEIVAVRGTGSVDGDIRAPRIAISDGAILCGRVETERAAVAAASERGSAVTARRFDREFPRLFEAFPLLGAGRRGTQTELGGFPEDYQDFVRLAIVDERDGAGVGRDAVDFRRSDAAAPVVRIHHGDAVARAAVLPLQ